MLQKGKRKQLYYLQKDTENAGIIYKERYEKTAVKRTKEVKRKWQ